MKGTHFPTEADLTGMVDWEVVDFSLLMPRWQLNELAQAAEIQGITIAQLLRHFIRQGLHRQHLQQLAEHDWSESSPSLLFPCVEAEKKTAGV